MTLVVVAVILSVKGFNDAQGVGRLPERVHNAYSHWQRIASVVKIFIEADNFFTERHPINIMI